MKPVLDLFQGEKVVSCKKGQKVLEEGKTSHLIYVLIEGEIEILKGDAGVTRVGEPGAIFGEMSVLLDVPHTATVRTTKASKFHVVDTGFVWAHPEFYRYTSIQLAQRLRLMTQLLAEAQITLQKRENNGQKAREVSEKVARIEAMPAT